MRTCAGSVVEDEISFVELRERARVGEEQSNAASLLTTGEVMPLIECHPCSARSGLLPIYPVSIRTPVNSGCGRQRHFGPRPSAAFRLVPWLLIGSRSTGL